MIVHLPTIKQLQYLVALRQHGHFGKRGRGLLRHPIDPFGRPARAGEPARRRAGRTNPPRGPLHAARRRRSRKRHCASCARAEELTDMARAEGKPLHGELRHGRHPDHRALPASGDASAAARAMAEPQALPARGDQPGRLRRAPPRPARLRAARDALRLRRRRQGRPVRRPPVRRLPARRSAAPTRSSSPARSTRTAC